MNTDNVISLNTIKHLEFKSHTLLLLWRNDWGFTYYLYNCRTVNVETLILKYTEIKKVNLRNLVFPGKRDFVAHQNKSGLFRSLSVARPDGSGLCRPLSVAHPVGSGLRRSLFVFHPKGSGLCRSLYFAHPSGPGLCRPLSVAHTNEPGLCRSLSIAHPVGPGLRRFGLVWFGLVYLFIQPATDVALDMSIQITAKEYNKLIRYGHLSTIINLGQLKQCYSYIKI